MNLQKEVYTPKNGILNWVKNHRVTAFLSGIFVFSFGGPLNFFGNNPKIFYFPAIAGCVLFCWITMSLTHKFVVGKSQESPTIQQQFRFYSLNAAAHYWQPPELPSDTRTSIEGKKLVTITIGNNTMSIMVGDEETEAKNDHDKLKNFFGIDLFTPYIKSNRLFIKAETPLATPQETIVMNDEWPQTIPKEWDRNFDKDSFEIVDDKGLPVFQVSYISGNSVQINGVFISPKTGTISVAFGGFSPWSFDDGIFNARKAWFQYPSNLHLGERVKSK
jgi:hypothetical protein